MYIHMICIYIYVMYIYMCYMYLYIYIYDMYIYNHGDRSPRNFVGQHDSPRRSPGAGGIEITKAGTLCQHS
jgi:hypothetical protein